MKRVFIVLLAALLLLTLFACKNKKDADSTDQSGTESEMSTVTDAPTDTEPAPATETENGDETDADGIRVDVPDESEHYKEHTVRYLTPDGKVIREETVPATDHVWRDEFDEKGHRQVCILCGQTGQTGDHVFGANGVCTVCGYGCEHAFSDTVVYPTCTDSGYTSYLCSKCGYAYSSDMTPATGHKYVENSVVPATCTENGTIVYKCTVCGASFTVNDDSAPATGHLYEDGVCVLCGAPDPSAETNYVEPDPLETDDPSNNEPAPFWEGEPFELPPVPIG